MSQVTSHFHSPLTRLYSPLLTFTHLYSHKKNKKISQTRNSWNPENACSHIRPFRPWKSLCSFIFRTPHSTLRTQFGAEFLTKAVHLKNAAFFGRDGAHCPCGSTRPRRVQRRNSTILKAFLVAAFAFFSVLTTFAESPAPHIRIAKVENEGLLFTDNKAGVTGVDGYFSLPIGRETVWFFGDVFLLDPTAPEKRWLGNVSNCALLTPTGKGRRGLSTYHFLTDPKTGLARPVIPNRPDEDGNTRFWPIAAHYEETSRVLYLYYNLVKFTGEGGPFGFKTIGYGLAKSDARDPEKLLFERIKGADGSELWGHSDSSPTFGLAVVNGMAGPYLYLIGDQSPKKNPHATLARVPKTRIADQQAYEYFSGTPASPGWSKSVSDAAGLIGLSGFSGSISIVYNKYLGGYLAVHHVAISEKIRLSIAPQPWGPYEMIGEISAPHRAFEKTFCYDGAEHPELAEDNGRIIYITYVDGQRYWEQLYKVTFDLPK